MKKKSHPRTVSPKTRKKIASKMRENWRRWKYVQSREKVSLPEARKIAQGAFVKESMQKTTEKVFGAWKRVTKPGKGAKWKRLKPGSRSETFGKPVTSMQLYRRKKLAQYHTGIRLIAAKRGISYKEARTFAKGFRHWRQALSPDKGKKK